MGAVRHDVVGSIVKLCNNPYYIAEDVLISISRIQRQSMLAAILVTAVSCPTGAVAEQQRDAVAHNHAVAHMPVCHFMVATDAPNPSAIYMHETWHCWGWVHPVTDNKGATDHFDKKMRAPIAPWKYRIKGEYPAKYRDARYELGKDVAKICDGNVYGCQWGGLQK